MKANVAPNAKHYASNLMSRVISNAVLEAAFDAVGKARELLGSRDGHRLTKTRWQLRRVVKNMHELVRGLKLKLALDKTFIGRIQKGFDFLGYRFNASGLCGLAQKTIDNHCNKRLRLDEPNAPDQRVQAYIASWMGCVRAGDLRPSSCTPPTRTVCTANN